MSKIISLSQDSSIRQAFKELNKFSEFGMIINIVSSKKKIIGVLTEGDLRRSILKGHSLDTKIKKVMNKNFFIFMSLKLSQRRLEMNISTPTLFLTFLIFQL